MSNNTTKISILLPTRGRTEQLLRSVGSLIDTADSPEEIEFLFGFDNDDLETVEWFQEHVIDKLDARNCEYTCMQFEPLGYERLNVYVNTLAEHAEGDWFVFWNDDAVMETCGWDTVIKSYTGRFCLQAFDTHNLHPYSIFPIVPREWLSVMGHLSKHQLSDAWMSQIAWMLDIVERIDVKVRHDRYDLTGNNLDSTFKNRKIFEGNVGDPRDFNHVNNRVTRFKEAQKIANYLKSKGVVTDHWDNVLAQKVDPWVKMLAADVNHQITKIAKA